MLIAFTKLRRKLSIENYIKLRRVFVAFINLLPFSARLFLFSINLKNTFPYSLISSDDSVLQVGMPADLVMQGRSRSLLFFKVMPRSLIIVEPDPFSVSVGRRVFNSLTRGRGQVSVRIIEGAVNIVEGSMDFFVNRKHQATNRSQVSNGSNVNLGSGFERIRVQCKPMINYIYDNNVPSVISVTTNGGELQVIRQYLEAIDNGCYPRLVCIAPPCEEAEDFFSSLGYTYLGLDDRGMSFVKSSS